MKHMRMMRMLVPAIAALLLNACDKSDPVAPENTTQATEDAAESIASAVGQDNGGATDQLSDVAELATVRGIQGQASFLLGKYTGDEFTTIDTSYDASTGTWTLILQRERGNPHGVPYAEISRTYTFQFLNKNGEPQKYYLVLNHARLDTAYSIKFNIVEGTGTHRTKRLSQHLTGLSGSWVATGTNTSVITINGTYHRSAVDTLTTRNAVRTLDHTLDLSFIDIKVPVRNRSDVSQRLSGTITGNYSATVTWTRGDSYSEKEINRDFTITLGSGKGNMNIDGLSFVADLASGELK